MSFCSFKVEVMGGYSLLYLFMKVLEFGLYLFLKRLQEYLR